MAPGCKREEPAGPTRAVEPYLQWCESQGTARGACLVSAATVSGDAAACAKLKVGAPERTACLLAAARTSGQVEACKTLSDRDSVICVFGAAAETGRLSSCEVLENIHWQGGATRALCTAVARGDAEACTALNPQPELGALCVKFAALRRKDAALCNQLGKDVASVQACAVAVAVARGAPEACGKAFAAAPDTPAQRRCELDASVVKGVFPPCFSDPDRCRSFLWVPRPCQGALGNWADDCQIHQAVFGTGPFGCGAVKDGERRALCAQLRDAQEGYTLAKSRAAGTEDKPAGGR
jgi:hypothetical protein